MGIEEEVIVNADVNDVFNGVTASVITEEVLLEEAFNEI
jgi:hypothetical protein